MDEKTAQQFKAWLEAEHVEASEQLAVLVESGASALQTYTPRVRRNDLECCLCYLAEFLRAA